MPTLALIEGLPKVGLTIPNIDRNVAVSGNGIDVAAWTPAEAHLVVVKRSLQLQAAYYGDSKGIYRRGIDQLENAITGNVSNFTFSGIQSPALDAVNRNISYAKSLIRSADRKIIDIISPEQKFASFGYGLNSVVGTLAPLAKEKWIFNFFRIKNVYRSDIDTSEAVIKSVTNDYRSFSKEFIYKYLDLRLAMSTFGLVPKSGEKFISDATDKIWKYVGDQFLSFNKWRSALYDKYEPTSHHVLYEFVENHTSESGTVQAKRINHIAALDAISRAAQIDRATMTIWTDNGVNAAYLKAYSEPIGGKASIEVLRSVNQPRIGVAPLVIIGAITAALTAANELLKTVKGTPEGDVLATVDEYGLPSNQPSVDDFPPPATQPDTTDKENQNSGTSDLLKYLPYALVGAAGLYYITNRKK